MTLYSAASKTQRMDAAAGRAHATGKQGEAFAIELAEQYRVEGLKLEIELDEANKRAHYEATWHNKLAHELSHRQYVNRCPHEWYQGRCIHCDVAAKDGKPA